MSFGNQRSVGEQLAPRFANTLFLAGVAAAISVPLAVTIGVLAALYRNSIFDRLANILTLTSISSPEFFVAYILILFLGVINPIFPTLSNISADLDFWTRVSRTMLPALTLTLVVTAHMMRMTRAAIINLLASPYIEMARLKGVSPARVIVRHALPNALAPIINVIALNLAYLITGVVVVEVVFVYPGVGQLFVDSVRIPRHSHRAGLLPDLRGHLCAPEPDGGYPVHRLEPAPAAPEMRRTMTAILYIAAVFVAAAAAAWAFRMVLITALPRNGSLLAKSMPLTASFGLLMILIYVFVSIFAPAIAPYGEAEVFDKFNALPGDDPRFALGTDQIGRDL